MEWVPALLPKGCKAVWSILFDAALIVELSCAGKFMAASRRWLRFHCRRGHSWQRASGKGRLPSQL